MLTMMRDFEQSDDHEKDNDSEVTNDYNNSKENYDDQC